MLILLIKLLIPPRPKFEEVKIYLKRESLGHMTWKLLQKSWHSAKIITRIDFFFLGLQIKRCVLFNSVVLIKLN